MPMGDWGGPVAGLLGGAASTAFNAVQAAKNRKFQKHMYKHRFQYSMRDMRKAGLNPILAAGMGLGGGGSPGGSMAQASGLSDLGSTVNTATQNKSLRKNLVKQREQIDVGMDKLRSDIEVNAANIRKADADADLSRSHIGLTNTRNTLEMLGIPNAALDASIAGSRSGQLARQTGVWMPQVQTLAQLLGALGIGRMAFQGRGANAKANKGPDRGPWRSAAPGAGRSTDSTYGRQPRVERKGANY